MNVTILAVGKLKDRFFEEGCGEYQKRLSRYCTLSVREAADEKAPEALSPAQEAQVKEREGKRLIGGSLGLSREAVDRADEELSLSKLTLPHRLARLVLLEQLYRSFKILNHETYHK